MDSHLWFKSAHVSFLVSYGGPLYSISEHDWHAGFILSCLLIRNIFLFLFFGITSALSWERKITAGNGTPGRHFLKISGINSDRGEGT